VETEETAAAPEAAPETEAAPEAAAEAAPETNFLDTLMSDEPPDSVQALEQAAERNGTDYKVSAEAFEQMPLEAKELVTNLRRMATRKAQETSELRKEFESRMKQLEQDRVKFEHEKASLLGMFKGNEKLKALLQEPEGQVSYDAFTEDGRRNLVAKEARELFGEFFNAIGSVSDEYKAAADEHAQQIRLNDERAKLTAFIKETPDWGDYAEATKQYVKQGLHWRDAYTLARAKNPPKANVDPIEESRREARRASKTGTRSSAAGATLDQLVRNSGY
jgi:hypothetical protein